MSKKATVITKARANERSMLIALVAGITLSAIIADNVTAAERQTGTKADAVSSKKPVRQNTLRQRITAPPTGPTVNSFLVNNGAEYTDRRNVVLDSSVNSATHFKAAESSAGLYAAGWKPYASSVDFILSAGNGQKTVYFQTKSTNGIPSSTRADSITLLNPRVLSVSINNGAAQAQKQTVNLNVAIEGAAMQYRASESSGFAGASWQPYSSAPEFELSDVLGNKRVYFQARNGSDFSNVVSDTISFTANTEYEVNGSAAHSYANSHGFSFSGKGNPESALANCNIAQFGTELRITATSNAAIPGVGITPLGASCRFKLFTGKSLNPPWRIKEVSILAGHDYWHWHETLNENSGDPSFTIDIDKPPVDMLPADVRIQNVKLLGPADAAWEDAFK